LKSRDIVLSEGDFVIKRISNGWIIHESCINKNEEDHVSTFVFEDGDHEVGDAESIKNLIQHMFSDYMRQNHRGGFEISFVKKGYRTIDND
jgi:hypothetical protein